MHTLKVAQPRAELRQFIRAFAQRDNGPLDPLFVQPTPAQLEQLMTFELGSPIEIRYPDGRIQVCDGVTVCGGQSRFVAHMHLPARMRSFGVFFQPTGFTQLFGIPIVALTAHASRQQYDECLREGMDAVITKPVDRPALLACIASVLPSGM